MSISYGPSGSSFVVRHGGRVVQRCRTELGALAAAQRLAGQFGGGVERESASPEPSPGPPPKSPPKTSGPPPKTPAVIQPADGPPLPDDFVTVLDLSIAKLTKRLAVGDLDQHLVALEIAEKGRANRKGALDAIRSRMDH